MRYDIEPVAKPRMTRRDKWAKRPCVLRYNAFKDKCRWKRVEVPASCRVIFHIPMPASWTKTEREAHDGKPHQQKPDLDNLLKGLMDAALREDCHVFDVRAEKRWSTKPGIEVMPW